MVVNGICERANFCTSKKVFGMWVGRVKLHDLEDNQVEYIEQSFDHEPTDEDFAAMQSQYVNIKKTLLLSELTKYDKSPNVDAFYVNGQFMWMDKYDRDNLSGGVNTELLEGITETTLWVDPINGIKFVLPCEAVLQMLRKVELYAKACFNRTAEHKYNITQLSTIEEVDNYDYTTGYPEKLYFEV